MPVTDVPGRSEDFIAEIVYIGTYDWPAPGAGLFKQVKKTK